MAHVAGAKVVVVDDDIALASTSVSTMAIVTQSGKNPRRSKIECHFVTDAGGVALYIVSKDQRRIEAVYQQIMTVAASGHSFQLTAYAHATDQADYHESSLESDVVYLILD